MSQNSRDKEMLAQLRSRLMQGHKTLKDEYGSLRPAAAGQDQAFIINQATRDALLQQEPKSASLLKPLIGEKNINKWHAGMPEQWVIHISPGTANLEDYPAIKQHLSPHKQRLEQRGHTHQWYEMHDDDHGYVAQPKIVYLQNVERPEFFYDKSGAHFAQAGIALPREDYYLLGMLNSRLQWMLLQGMAETAEGAMQIKVDHLESLPCPTPTVEQRGAIGATADYCMRLAWERHDFRAHICREIAINAVSDESASLSDTLNKWHLLDIFSFRDEIRRHFGQEIQPDMLPAWEGFLGEGKSELNKMNMDMDRAERKIDLAMYEMFGLTEEEIEFIERVYPN